VKAHKKAKVISLSKKECTRARPLALNTVELLRSSSAGLGIGPHQAMQIAERLYTQGYISYPRTETTSYPPNFDLVGTLRIQTSNSEWSDIASALLSEGIKKPRTGHDAGDHPPITPMKSASRNTFPDKDAWKVYEFIARHFIGTISGDLKYERTTVRYSIGDEKFSKSFDVVLNPGFTQIMNWLEMESSHQLLSGTKVGDEFAIAEAKLNERQTSPPDYLTEADLISLMEKHGIGTDASIPTHINNICLRNYVKVSSGRRLVPTKLGIVLVHGYQRIDKSLVLPTSRASVEKKLNLIAEGKASYETVLQNTLDDFSQKFDNFSQNIQAMDELFEVSFSSLAESGKPLSRCGKCRRYLKLITAKPQRLYCPNCDETYSLPANGSLRTYKELKCPLDEFELLYFSGQKGKSFVLCPQCYSGNKSDLTFNCFNEATKVLITNEKCEKCDSKLVDLYHKKETEVKEIKGCVFCSPELKASFEIKDRSARQFRPFLKSANAQEKHTTIATTPDNNTNGDNYEHFQSNRSRGRGGGGGGGGRRGSGRGGPKHGLRGASRGSRGKGRGKSRGQEGYVSQDKPKGLQLFDFF